MIGVEPASLCQCVHPCVHTLKHKYLKDQRADRDQILSDESLG